MARCRLVGEVDEQIRSRAASCPRRPACRAPPRPGRQVKNFGAAADRAIGQRGGGAQRAATMAAVIAQCRGAHDAILVMRSAVIDSEARAEREHQADAFARAGQLDAGDGAGSACGATGRCRRTFFRSAEIEIAEARARPCRRRANSAMSTNGPGGPAVLAAERAAGCDRGSARSDSRAACGCRRDPACRKIRHVTAPARVGRRGERAERDRPSSRAESG